MVSELQSKPGVGAGGARFPAVNPKDYDRVIVAYSGGKDSLACLLYLLELGVDPMRIECWHHDVDGGPDRPRYFDWPVTADYCRKTSAYLSVDLLFNWRDGGFHQEMHRDGTATGAVRFQSGVGGPWMSAGGRGPAGTRLKFPQVSADLSVRWCSAYLKVDVARRVLANDPRFTSGRYLLVTGERREESAARSKYAEVEEHFTSSTRRTVHQWRPVIDWSETQVWDIIRRHGIVPHPAYRLGWGRVSCMLCIFGGPDQWASARAIAPESFEAVALKEQEFGVTIQRNRSVTQLADAGTPFEQTGDEDLVRLALSEVHYEPVVTDRWELPAGAYKRGGGPS